MRFIRIATIIITIGTFSAIPAIAQESDIDDLLNELNFGDDFGADDSQAATDDVINDVNGDAPESVETPSNDDFFDMDMQDAEPAVDADDDFEFEEMGSSEEAATGIIIEEPEEDSEPTLTEEPDESAKELAQLMAQQEEVRRQASEKKGNINYEEGMQALEEGEYEKAVKALEEARFNLPVRSQNAEKLEEIRLSLGEAYTEIARDQMKSDLTYARQNIDQALEVTPENRRAQSTAKRIAAREAKLQEMKDRPKSVTKQPKYREKYDSVDDLMREGRDLYNAGEYNDAELAFERVLQLDEYNVDAMRYLRRIEENRFEIKTKEREATVADMMAMVRDTWNPPIRTDSQAPVGTGQQTQIDSLSNQERLQKKMEAIVIPSIEFRSANITDVVNFLVDASVAGDPDGIGVNIILKLSMPGETASAAPAQQAPVDNFGGFGGDDFGFGGDFGATAPQPATVSGGANVPAITLNLRRINLLDAIKYITEVAELRYRLEDNVVIITPANVVSGRVITRMYPVQPSILDVIIEEDTSNEDNTLGRQGDFIELGSQVTSKRSDVKEFFERTGVPFPVGTSITYNQSISQLIVANTVENLENFERILARLNVIPNQVEIEARFVEVNQDDLEELGFQWFLTDNWEIAQRTANVAGGEQIIGRSDSEGYTKGNRFFAFNGSSGNIEPTATPVLDSTQAALGGIATFASVLTNPELTLIINALDQSGGTDLLSAPRVTTRSGVNAKIKVVEEIIYPTDFTTESFSGDVNTDNNFGGVAPTVGSDVIIQTPIIVYPDTFDTREAGVILDVTPTVGPDGYTIDLVLVPEVAELVDWIQYGQAPYNVPQPIFSSRKVTTSIVVWDGQTVVLGGLIREDLIKYEDKIPLLGDLPILGRLFRSKGEYSRKKNLLIFVTARLVGPDGKPIQREEAITDTTEVVVQ